MRRRNVSPLMLLAAMIALAVSAWMGREAAAPVPAEKSKGQLEQLVPDAVERAELVRTLDLIERGGPFPHRQDGTTFGNRERQLPERPRGYYHEYTVRTPGAPNRGARRVIRGDGGELYYTRDHYRTFIRIDNE